MLVCNKMLQLGCHFLTKQSFCHFVNQASNPKTSFTKFVKLVVVIPVFDPRNLSLKCGENQVVNIWNVLVVSVFVVVDPRNLRLKLG